MHTIGQRILLSRRDLSIDQGDLGKRVGLSQARISELERGKAKSVDLNLIEQIAEALGVSPQYLVGWQEDPLYAVKEESLQIAEREEISVYQTRKLADPETDELVQTYMQLADRDRWLVRELCNLLITGARGDEKTVAKEERDLTEEARRMIEEANRLDALRSVQRKRQPGASS